MSEPIIHEITCPCGTRVAVLQHGELIARATRRRLEKSFKQARKMRLLTVHDETSVPCPSCKNPLDFNNPSEVHTDMDQWDAAVRESLK